jgi:hypothetical protein
MNAIAEPRKGWAEARGLGRFARLAGWVAVALCGTLAHSALAQAPAAAPPPPRPPLVIPVPGQ